MTNPDDKPKPEPIDVLDAIYEDAAREDAKHGTSTPAQREWAAGVRQRVYARLDELRRQAAPRRNDVAPEPVTPPPIRASYLALARDALIAAIEEISRRMGGQVMLAHRNLSNLSDDDLRRLLETLSDPE